MVDEKNEALPLAPLGVGSAPQQTPTKRTRAPVEPTPSATYGTKPPQPYRKPSAQKKLVGKGQGSPNHAAKSVKNSYTSPKAIHRQKRKLEALQLREQGYSFDQIAKHMHCAVGTVHGYVTEAIKEIPAETAAEVLRLELRRLDSLLSAYYGTGVEGDIPAAALALKVMDQKARLLGLYPKEGSALSVSVGGGQAEDVSVDIRFVLPDGREALDEPKDVSPSKIAPAPRRDYAKPEEPVIDAEVLPNTSGVPRIKRKPTDWMG